MGKEVIVIGSGVAGLAGAARLGKLGHRVRLLEKNATVGGRARQFMADGFTFDMGPSWYWMPDVFEHFFNQFGYTTADFYDLQRLDPSYRVYFKEGQAIDLPASLDALLDLMENLEAGSANKLKRFLKEAQYKYEVGMKEFVWKVSDSVWEFADKRIIASMFRMQMFRSLSSQVRRLFRNEKIIKILEFPVLFLGAAPQHTPAMYSLMNYADISLGTWYPMGGMYKIVEAMVRVAQENGVVIETNAEVMEVAVKNGKVDAVVTAGARYHADAVIGAADYHHLEQVVLPASARQYTPEYWSNRRMAPSSLLYYVGVNKKLKGICHHNLFFDADFERHAKEIYQEPKWPVDPLFYVCAPSVTDPAIAPPDKENLFVLIPTAPGLQNDDEPTRQRYLNLVFERIETRLGQSVVGDIAFCRSYAQTEFIDDYHAYKGNAYGLANTLAQTAFLKPKMVNKKLKNFLYAGQLTTPGPGLPPSLISGQVAALHLHRTMR